MSGLFFSPSCRHGSFTRWRVSKLPSFPRPSNTPLNMPPHSVIQPATSAHGLPPRPSHHEQRCCERGEPVSLQDLVFLLWLCARSGTTLRQGACSTLSVAAASFYSPASSARGLCSALSTPSPALPFSALFMFCVVGDCSVVLGCFLPRNRRDQPCLYTCVCPRLRTPRLPPLPLRCLGARVELSAARHLPAAVCPTCDRVCESVHALSSFLRLLPLPSPQSCSLCLWFRFCPADGFISTAFLDPIYVH